VFIVVVHLPFILALILFASGGVMRSGAVGVMMHLVRAVPVMVAPEWGVACGKKEGEEREVAARTALYTLLWRLGPPASESARSGPFV
jgi:hypothetical protein